MAAVGRNADLFNLESLCYVNPAAQWLVFGPTNAHMMSLQRKSGGSFRGIREKSLFEKIGN